MRAFEEVLKLDPDYPGAAQNVEVAKRIVAFMEDLQSQSDTGEEAGIGADDVVFDNESGRGAETQIQVTGEEGVDKRVDVIATDRPRAAAAALEAAGRLPEVGTCGITRGGE